MIWFMILTDFILVAIAWQLHKQIVLMRRDIETCNIKISKLYKMVVDDDSSIY